MTQDQLWIFAIQTDRLLSKPTVHKDRIGGVILQAIGTQMGSNKKDFDVKAEHNPWNISGDGMLLVDCLSRTSTVDFDE